MLLAHEVVIDPLLGVTHDEKGPTRVAHLHGLLVVGVLLFVIGDEGPFELVPFFFQLIRELHETLGLFHIALTAFLLGLFDQGRDLLAKQTDLIGHFFLRSRQIIRDAILILRKKQTLFGLFDAVLKVDQHALTEPNKLLDMLGLFERRLFLGVKFGLEFVIVDLATRAQIGFGVGEELVRAEIHEVVFAHVRIRPQ